MADILHLIGNGNHCAVPMNLLLTLQELLMQCGLSSFAVEGNASAIDSEIIYFKRCPVDG